MSAKVYYCRMPETPTDRLTVEYAAFCDTKVGITYHTFNADIILATHGTCIARKLSDYYQIHLVEELSLAAFSVHCWRSGASTEDVNCLRRRIGITAVDCECGHDKHQLGFSTWCPAFDRHNGENK